MSPLARKVGIAVGAIALAATLAVGGHRFYRDWKKERLFQQAGEFVTKSDLRSATLCLQKILAADQNHLSATLLMAQLVERVDGPNLLAWRRRVVELAPDVPEHRIAWATIAIRQQQFAVAEQALHGITEPQRETAAYHHAASALAAAQRQGSKAEHHAREAVRLDPTSSLHRFNLASIQMQSGDAEAARLAREVVRQLRIDPTLGCEALRALVSDALRRQQTEEAFGFSQQVQFASCAGFADRIQHLTLVEKLRPLELPQHLSALQRQAERQPLEIFSTATWMIQNRLAKDALEWLRSLPVASQKQQPVCAATADCLAAVGDWMALEKYLKDQDWVDLDPLRRAMLARSFKERADKRNASIQWTAAVNKAADRAELLTVLARFSGSWGWQEETDQLLWAVADRTPDSRWALDSLYRRYQARGDTPQLLRVLSRVVSLAPGDDAVKNNYSVFSLLLNLHVDRAGEFARELHQKYPTNAAIASTYALALHRQGSNAAAVKVLGRLSEEQLRDPSVAAYYGIVLAERGERERARPYLELAATAKLLPEEAAMVDRAKKRLKP